MNEWMFLLPILLIVGFFAGLSTKNRGRWMLLLWKISAFIERKRGRNTSDVSVHIPVACDLSEAALIDAMEHARAERFYGQPGTLICGVEDGPAAGRLAEKFHLRVIVLPVIPRDAWALCWSYSAVYSKGA